MQRAEIKRITAQVIARAGLSDVADDAGLRRLIAQELPDEDEASRKLRQVVLQRVQAAIAHPELGEFVAHVPELCDCPQGTSNCADACAVGAIRRDEQGNTEIDRSRCVDCGLCVDACQSAALVERTHCLSLAEMLRHRQQRPVYAILAPAFVAQFGADVTPTQVKAGLRRLGFTDVLEVALAADIITALESEEYIQRRQAGGKFMITSCCCPAFIKLVEKHRPKTAHLVSDSVSPMIALGRLLKLREPNCRVVFIGPCLAKRSEAKRPELADAIDSVLTFKETGDLLRVAGIDLRDDWGESTVPLAEASHDGRIYAHTGGVTASIRRAIAERAADQDFRPLQGDGLKQCNQILQAVEDGTVDGNFMEGMACPGGCVGGPGTCVSAAEGAEAVERFAAQAHTAGATANQLADAWRRLAPTATVFLSDKA